MARDGWKCRVCGATECPDVKLDAHHILSRDSMPGGGYVSDNGITLCDLLKGGGCHEQAERGRIVPGVLFNLIRSSEQKARAMAAEQVRRLRAKR